MGREGEGSDLWEWETPRVLFVVPGSPVRSVGGNVGGISVSVGELVPGGLQ